MKEETGTFCPASRKKWRQWLQKQHDKKGSVWLILYKRNASQPSISWSNAVDEALCFGWIDSKRKPLDEEKFMQFFSKRRPGGTWSAVNKEKIQHLIADGLMREAGLNSIERAKQNGSWTLLEEAETLKIPKDLAEAFKGQPRSAAFFNSLSKSVRKSILKWLLFAKRPETRQKRVNEISALAAQQRKPKQF